MNPTIVGCVAGLLCTISFLPQVIKIYTSKRTEDISLATFAILSTGVLLWLVYGIMVEDLPIIVTNAVVLVLSLAIVVMKVRYH